MMQAEITWAAYRPLNADYNTKYGGQKPVKRQLACELDALIAS